MKVFQGMGHAGFHLVFVMCCLSQVAMTQGAPGANPSLEERVFTASKVHSLLELHFLSSETVSAPDLEGVYKDYLRRVLATDDRRRFDMATIEFVAQLHNGHTFFWDTALDESNNQPLGFRAMPLDGKWVVQVSFLDDLKSGEIISKIDDAPMEAFFLQQRRYISASSTAAQRRNLFLLPFLFPAHFTLTLESGPQVTVDRRTTKKPPEKVEGRWLQPGATAYISISSFFDPSLEEMALNYVRQFHKAKTLIIDVRGNAGGIPPERLIIALMDRPYRGWLEATKRETCPFDLDQKSQSNATNAEASRSSKVVQPSRNAYRGRLILLIDGGCVSACEDLVEPFKDSGRGTIVGETTQGSSGVPFSYDFRNGMTLRIAVKRNYFPDGSEFEGVGIKPDIEVHTTIEDLKRAKDPVLEKALELAEKP